MQNLELIPLQDLLDELENRYDDMVFVGSMRQTEETEKMDHHFSGDLTRCLGLVDRIKDRIKDSLEGYEDDYAE